MFKHKCVKMTISIMLIPILVLISMSSCQKVSRLVMNEPSSYEIGADGSVVTISFITNRYWQINCSETWIKASPSSGFGSDNPIYVTIHCDANKSFEDRDCSLSINVPELSRTIKIFQEANEGIYAVDMGLSLLWASCNIGASTPWDYGNYYAWGEIATKEYYSWDTYQWGPDYYYITKYNVDPSRGIVDNKTQLDPSDDVAQVLLGDKWRIPSKADFEELIATMDQKKYQWELKSMKGVIGWEVRYLANGNSLFFPFAGEWNGPDVIYKGKWGYYWTSTLCDSWPENSFLVTMYQDLGPGTTGLDRTKGYPIRPVRSKK